MTAFEKPGKPHKYQGFWPSKGQWHLLSTVGPSESPIEIWTLWVWITIGDFFCLDFYRISGVYLILFIWTYTAKMRKCSDFTKVFNSSQIKLSKSYLRSGTSHHAGLGSCVRMDGQRVQSKRGKPGLSQQILKNHLTKDSSIINLKMQLHFYKIPARRRYYEIKLCVFEQSFPRAGKFR